MVCYYSLSLYISLLIANSTFTFIAAIIAHSKIYI